MEIRQDNSGIKQNDLKNTYKEVILPNLISEFNYLNIHQVPKLVKIQINRGLGLEGQNNKILQRSIEEICLISGQQPILTKAKKSIAGFKVREKMILGLTVTLRGKKMYCFLEKLVHLVLPRIRDFRGLSIKRIIIYCSTTTTTTNNNNNNSD